MFQIIWQEFLKIVKEESGSNVVETWFKAVSLNHWDAHSKVVYLCAPNPFVRDWLTSKYMELFQIHLSRLLNESQVKVIIFVEGESVNINHLKISQEPSIIPARPIVSNKIVLHNNKNLSATEFNFDNFIVGPNNKLAYSAARAVVEGPGTLYNPLFIYGGSGLGKTHLLRAVYHDLKLKDKSVQVLYQTADRFVNEFINAIRFDKTNFFESKYRNVDALIIDDIQFLSNKEQTQEAFFHIFNSLQESKKQIVFSSDALPEDIIGLAGRLRSRLEGGLIVDIQAPPLETRVAILKKKAEFQEVKIEDDVAYFIASRVFSNVRELEGMLIRLIAYSSLTSESISLKLAQKVLGTNPKETKPGTADLQRIAQTVARYYQYNLEDLRSSSRNKNVTLARHVAMYFMKKLTDKSLKDIGTFWCRKDHSTVIHALEKISYYKDTDASWGAELERIEHEIFV